MKLNVGFCIIFLSFITLHATSAQVFRFADTHPVNNADSLEQWAKLNPQPSVLRLKNLISLERTYTWNNAYKLGTHFYEINQLVQSHPNPTAQAAFQYLSAFKYYQDGKRFEAIQPIKKAVALFQSVNDRSGLIHSYVLLSLMQYNMFGGSVGKDEFFRIEYSTRSNQLLKQSTNIHDILQGKLILTKSIYGSGKGNPGLLRKTSEETLQKIKENPVGNYASYKFNKTVAIGYYLEKKYNQSYQQNKKIITSFTQNQIHERITILFNLSNDCNALTWYAEEELYAKEVLLLLKQYEPENYSMLRATYDDLKEAAIDNGKFREALALSDSVQKYQDENRNADNNKKMLELQGQYEFEKKQQQIRDLQQKQHQVNRQNKLILIVLSPVILLAVVFGILLHQLRTANQKLEALTKSRERFFGIIAHDLRRPMHAFQGMNKLVGYYLKTERYEAIEKLSQAIDEAGFKIQLMLDNLLRWSLAQREELPYYPQQFTLLPKIQDVVGLFDGLFFKHPIVFSINCPETLHVYADPDSVELVLRNIVTNAVNALNDKPGTITIEALPATENSVEISITDTANGIEPMLLSVVCQLLQHPVKAQVGEKGIGMGIILISQFTARNKGTVTVKSSSETGTTFTLTLPHTLG